MSQLKTISYRQALDTVLAHCTKLPAEDVAFLQALGRVLAQDVCARADDPPAAKSAMDGFALNSSETRGATAGHPIAFAFDEVVGAGHVSTAVVTPGRAVRIMTGALLPEGGDAVVKQEDTQPAQDGRFALSEPLQQGENVIAPGAALRAGQRLLAAGEVVTAQGLALLASQGITRVPVRRRPRVVLLALGDELVEPGTEPGAGQLYVSNLYALEALCTRYGAQARRLGIAPDDPARIADMLAAGLGGGAQGSDGPASDVVLTLGGSHQGDFDFVDDVLTGLGAQLRFRRTRINMGGSTLFATRGATLFFGLPGTPAPSWLAFELLVRPALWALSGRRRERPLLRARLSEGLAVRRGRTSFIPATLAFSGDDGPSVRPLVRGTPLALPAGLLADGLIRWPEDCERLEAGAWVDVEWLGES